MVDIAQFGRANGLINEVRNLTAALDQFEAGNPITSFTLGGTFNVSSEGIEYPPQMLTAVRQQLEQRLTSLQSELAELGVTGIEAEPRAAATPAPQQPPPPPQQPPPRPGAPPMRRR